MKNLMMILLLFVGSSTFLSAQATLFVKHDATGLNDGSSWVDAYTTLQPAINAAVEDDQIWVATGTYLPTLDNPGSTDNTTRDRSFYINKKISIYGGFLGIESNLTNRDWTVNETILSGDLGVSGVDTDNALHVVFFDSRNGVFPFLLGALLDGFTVEKGNANKTSFMSNRGGGLYNYGEVNLICLPYITNCKFRDNKAGSGGAMFNAGYDGTCNPQIEACMFENNSSTDHGGAIFNDGTEGVASPRIYNCIFTNNISGAGGGAIFNDGAFGGICRPHILESHFSNNSASTGGAIYNGSTFGSGIVEPNITNCWFTANTATTSGGAISFSDHPNGDMKATISNCVFQNNGAAHISYDDGAANEQPHFINCTFYGATDYTIHIVDFSDGATPLDFTNCIFWGNNNDLTNGTVADNNRLNIQYSIVEEMAFAPNNNNIHDNPIFVDAPNGDFHLDIDSPAFDIGDNAVVTATQDIEGNPRIENTIVNMGAFEGITMTSLPLSYVHFSGKTLPKNNLLEWQVSNEYDTQIHLIERSNDGQDFKQIGAVAPSDDPNLTTYQWVDEQATSQAYYQIRTLDKNGQPHSSNVIWLDRTTASSFAIQQFYPNPVQTRAVLNFYAPKAEQLELEITDVLGKVVYKETVKSILGQNQVLINGSLFPRGQYWLRLVGQVGVLGVRSFVVE